MKVRITGHAKPTGSTDDNLWSNHARAFECGGAAELTAYSSKLASTRIICDPAFRRSPAALRCCRNLDGRKCPDLPIEFETALSWASRAPVPSLGEACHLPLV